MDGPCYQVRNNMWVCVMARSAAAIKRQEEVKFFAEPEVDKYNTHLRISQLSTTLSIDLDTFVEMYFSLQVHLSGNAVGHLQTTNKKHKRGDILSSVISASVLEFLSFFWPQSSSHHRIKAMRSLLSPRIFQWKPLKKSETASWQIFGKGVDIMTSVFLLSMTVFSRKQNRRRRRENVNINSKDFAE